MISLKCFHFNALQCCCTVLWIEGGSSCVIVDPGMTADAERERLTAYLAEKGLTPEAILLTHGHFDHIFGVAFLLRRYPGLPVYMHPLEKKNVRIAPAYASYIEGGDIENDFETTDIADGEILRLAGLELKVIETPGHAPGAVAYYEEKHGILLCGDTLFAGSIGRSDLPGGDYDALMSSILNKLMVLPGKTDVIPGHGPATSIAREGMTNPFLQPFNDPDPDGSAEPLSLDGWE